MTCMLWAPLVGTAGAPGMGFPAPSLPTSSISCDSFAPLHLELLQQLQLIFQRSHFTSTGQGLEVAAVGIWGVSAILSQLFCLFPVIEEQFSQCIRQMCGVCVLSAGFRLVPWHQSDCAGFCYRHLWGKVSVCHIQKMPPWSRLLSFFLWFLVSLFFYSVVNISVFPVKIAIFFETQTVFSQRFPS